MKLLTWLITIIVLVGCAGHKGTDYQNAKMHMLYIDGDGNLIDPNQKTIIGERGDLKKTKEDEKAYLENIFQNYMALQSKDKTLRITLFIHGGLNNFSTAVDRPGRMVDDMLADHQYPIFIAWNSDFWPNYGDHLFRIRKGLNRPVLGAMTSPVVLIEDLGRSLVRVPSSLYKEISDPVAVLKSVTVADEKDYQKRVDKLDEKGFQISNSPPHVGVRSDYYTVWNPVKLGMAPLVDGFGTGAWDGMLRRTDLVLTKNIAFEGDLITEPDREFKGPVRYADTAVTALLHRLEKKGNQQDSPYHVEGSEINIVGHSMGAIVAVNILARHPDLNVNNLVFMGAAARVKEVENVVVPWLVTRPEVDFWNLSLDPYREVGENFFFDFMPRGSLLNWIDYTFGEVNSFKDRTAGSWWNMTRLAEDIFPDTQVVDDVACYRPLRNRVHLTRFPIDNHGKWPQKHGEFADYKFWREGYWMAESAVKLDRP